MGGKKEFEEAPARHFRAGDQFVWRQRGENRLGQLTRVAACGFCEAQRNVRGEVAMLGITRPLDADCGGVRWLREGARRQSTQGGQQELLELLLQGILPVRVARK